MGKAGVTSDQFVVDVFTGQASTLAEDVKRGLGATPKRLPSKYFYDERGSVLFDEICNTEDYYPTRTEEKLLEEVADDVIERSRPTSLVELGSGAARKTRTLLQASERLSSPLVYIPFDVSESMLRKSGKMLLGEFPWLRVHGVVGDYELHLDRIPSQGTRLIAFLGGTIGNFGELEGARFLRKVSATMGPKDRLLLGTDLVKETAVLNRAYNDGPGLTAEFNKNVLRVINRELHADFDLDRFTHLAFYREELSRVEMHLQAKEAHVVNVEDLDLRVPFSEGETILTEISRKFTKESVQSLLSAAGLKMESWYLPGDGAFAISVSRPIHC